MNLDQTRSIFVVGDDAQSIYAFRGSKIEIILNFEKEYPGAKEIILNQNYRSTQPILDLAEKVLTHNPNQKKKDLFTQNTHKIHVNYYLARNERDEAEYIIRQLYHQYILGAEPESAHSQTTVETSHSSDLTLEPDDFFDNPNLFIKNSKPGLGSGFSTQSASNDPVSNMFDVYLDTSDSYSSGYSSHSSFNPMSWSVPEYKWDTVEKLNECAVLYRTHSQSRSLEEMFLKYRLPYRLVSGVRFLDRREIKDVVAMLKYLLNRDDKISLSRFLPIVMDGVGPKTLEKIVLYLEDPEYPLAPKYQSQILDLNQKMQSTLTNNDSIIALLKELVVATGYARYLKAEFPKAEEFQARMENIGELYSLMLAFDEDRSVSVSERLQNFLAQVSLMSQLDQQDDDRTPKINLMSLHQSKGLEFETVFLVGVEDGLLPHQNSFLEPGGMEEEVRLAYVGVTRAKRYLHLISADSRVQFGQIKANPVSRIFRPFLDTHTKRSKK